MRTLARASFAGFAALAVSAPALTHDRILVAGYESNNILSFYAESFEFEAEVLGAASGVSAIYAALLHQHRLYACDWNANTINQFDAGTGAWIATISSFGGQGAADLPGGIAVGSDGMLVVSSSRENVLRRFDPNTAAPLGIFVGVDAGLSQPDAIIRASTGHYLVCSRANDTIFRISADGSAVEKWIWDDPEIPGDSTGGLRNPQGIVELDDTLLVSSGGTHAVHLYRTSDGMYIRRFVNTGAGGLFDPRSLGVLPSGEVLVASNGTNTIKRYSATGAFVSDFGQNAPYSFSSPTAVLLDVSTPGPLLGDTNCDGVVTVGDIGPFVLALTDPAGYAAAFPQCDPMAADCSGDGAISVGDIGPFVSLVAGG